MPDYRRNRVPGGTYFFTLVTARRQPVLCHREVRAALRGAIERVRADRPFCIEAWVLLPDHLHCIWTLPDGDSDYSGRWRLIKLCMCRALAQPRFWQRRFWEHTVRDGADLKAHLDYIHYNPVRHGLCASPGAWPYSTFHRFVRAGMYPAGWGADVPVRIPDGVGKE